MRLLSSQGHPNGLKILVASHASGQTVEVVVKRGVLEGAALEVCEGGVAFQLQANSAVLYLLPRVGGAEESWLEWETGQLQPVLVPYLASVVNGREDKELKASLSTLLATLTASYTLDNTEVRASSVVLACSLLPLLSEKVTTSLLQDHHPNLLTFLTTLRDTHPFKECVTSWWMEGKCNIKTWVGEAAAPPPPPTSPSHSTLALLKATATTTSSSSCTLANTTTTNASTADQAKPARGGVSTEAVKEAQDWWHDPSKACPPAKVTPTPILPVEGERNILVTSALPYVNNVPHLGNIIGCVLSGDCFTRFCRLRGDNVLYICGTDEYGTATETKAIAEGLTPKQICDKYHAIHSEVYRWFNIDFDYFGRTTTQHQTKIAQDIFHKLDENGYIIKESVEQLYCGKCERFLADRFVEGTCPHLGCGYEDARGDQCDGCSKLVNAMELIRPRCKLCSKTPEIRSSNHLFLDLPSIEPKLRSWLPSSSPQWSPNSKVICDAWIKDGLKTRCITRDLKWGTPVPKEGFKEKVFYVWFDAPIGYISITANYTDQWKQWWQNPSQVLYYEFMAKDNVPFHSVVFPCTLLGTNQDWTKVTHLVATEYLNYEDGKFSKSRGVGVFGDAAMNTGIPSDVWRFYLLFLRPESQDTSFSWADLQLKNNSDLLNNLGNFVHRALTFVAKFFARAVPAAKRPTPQDWEVMAAINRELSNYTTALATNHQREALRCVLSITKIGNQYIQDHEPYRLVKSDRSEEEQERGATVIAIAANIVALVSIILDPFMPQTAASIRDFLNNPPQLRRLPQAFTQFLSAGHSIKEPHPLITQLDDASIQNLISQFAGQQDKSEKKEKETPQKVVEVDPSEVARLQALVEAQGNKVRQLKAGGTASKAEVDEEVATLLSLKVQLAMAQGGPVAGAEKDKKKGKKGEGGGGGGKENAKPHENAKPTSTTTTTASAPTTNASPAAADKVVDEAEVSRLQALVTQQGDKVRSLKAGGAGKEVVGAEVAVLLDLKQKLTKAQGVDPATTSSKDKKKNK